jgi:hypothetical protein
MINAKFAARRGVRERRKVFTEWFFSENGKVYQPDRQNDPPDIVRLLVPHHRRP